MSSKCRGRPLGKGGGFADLEFAPGAAAGQIGPLTVAVTTVHELQVRIAGTIPLTDHDVPVDFIITPERVIDSRLRPGAAASPRHLLGRPDGGEDRGKTTAFSTASPAAVSRTQHRAA